MLTIVHVRVLALLLHAVHHTSPSAAIIATTALHVAALIAELVAVAAVHHRLAFFHDVIHLGF